MHALLNRHPQIALLYEAEPLDLWPENSAMFPARNWPQRLEFFNQTFTRHRLLMEPFARVRPGPDAARALYREYARERKALISGEKAPSYHTRLPMLGKLFPNAQFLIIWRDPVECCRSAARAARKNRFFAQRGMMIRILLGAEKLAEGVETLQQEKRNVCEVVYDELTQNSERELKRVCEFLKIPFSPAMLDLKAADTSSVPSGEHHAGVRSGLIVKAAGAEEVLTAAFIAKGQRYAKFWRERFSGLSFARALSAASETGPGAWERFTDHSAANWWWNIDRLKRVAFRRIPLSLWRRLRSKPRKSS